MRQGVFPVRKSALMLACERGIREVPGVEVAREDRPAEATVTLPIATAG
jgi:hypothetical protein